MNFKNDESVFDGLEIGACTVKWVRRTDSGRCFMGMVRHEGEPVRKIEELYRKHTSPDEGKLVVTGQSAKSLVNVPYYSETECLEKALGFFNCKPDLLLALGGENFCIYTLRNGKIQSIIPSSKCAAGTGEFIVQQFQRMDLSLESGIEESLNGKVVELATRCSVYCKSDATHKLNKGECKRSDIARTLICDLARKVSKLIDLAQWKADSVVITGGLVLNEPFISHLRELLPDSELKIFEQSPCLEAFGAALFASELPEDDSCVYSDIRFRKNIDIFETLRPLTEAEALLDFRVNSQYNREVVDGASYIMGVDAGSTTTKIILYNLERDTVDASCYLRTHGNPVTAVQNCLRAIKQQVAGKKIDIIQTAVTGSGRGIVSVFLDDCASYNEILAHARAAVQEVPDVDTVFEIGGQDSKFISFLNQIPIDYAMNDGCSAGTGSFLEESVSVDMGIPVEEISNKALGSSQPVSFGERCAAFINTDLRNAMQQGIPQEDVIAGLVYSIARNYISRIVGVRTVGDSLLFQGGVALNKSVGLAMAALTGRKVVVPTYPELMGCVGSSLMAKDRLKDGGLSPKSYDLDELLKGSMVVEGTFQCSACENVCEIKKIRVHGKVHPFGGLCSKYETRRQGAAQKKEGRDLISLRNQLMFEKYGLQELSRARGTIGIPMALAAYEYFPFYARLINEFGFNGVLSATSKDGNSKTLGSICYPSEIAHGAVYDLLTRDVDYIFLPHILDGGQSATHLHSYLCANTSVIPDLVRMAFNIDEKKLLHPNISFSVELKESTMQQIVKLGAKLGVKKGDALRAGMHAFEYYAKYKAELRDLTERELKTLFAEQTVILAARPYVICSSEVNLALPRKIISRGYNVLSADMLPPLPENSDTNMYKNNAWYFTQQIMNSIAYARKYPNFYICLVSCFSCIPDASMYHLYRDQLAGETFCYLEIDSHTAHAGFETRIGAFLDIVELRETRVPVLVS